MKLKKLILAGFKSFADKTEFEFHDGISCVVGPNGCGKSNIVDAVKWVLGEQSAKSLRGSEMLDVIFNGSSGRRASGMAEVTLAFDNSSGILQPAGSIEVPADGTVAVTRRLYRSGQSEYLINKAPCRLKDIREMFMDTGVGRDAYSLIEQGRVEVFLQAGRDERRAIFDEAAGISKYKARKKEALRKLDRVEQNLLRLSDIVGEIEKRLRSIKYQAGKARNYQAYTERLRELRSLHFLARYHTLGAQRVQLQGRLDAGTDQLAAVAARIDQLESAGSAAEIEAVDLERAARELQGRIAAAGGQIITAQQRADMLTARVKELGEQIILASSRCEELEAKVAELDEQIAARRAESERIDARGAALEQQYTAVREELDSGERAVTHLEAQLADEKAGTIDLLRRTATLHNEIQAHGIRRENLHGQRERLSQRARTIAENLTGLLTERAQVETKLSDVMAVLEESQQRLEGTRQTTRQLIDSEQGLQKQLAEARERRSAVQSRTDVLKEMQQRLEGLGGGVRKALAAHREGRLEIVEGMLGDFLQTDVAHAATVEAALAGADEHLIVPRRDHLPAVRDELAEIVGNGGAVEVIALDAPATLRSDLDLSTLPAVRARVIDWVRFPATLAPAMWRLLGRTLVVETLTDALATAKTAPDATRFVTLAGDVLEAGGHLRVGAANRGAGVISRRSELAELDACRQELDEKIGRLQQACQQTHEELEHQEKVAQELRTAIYEANTERVECRSRCEQLTEQIDAFQREQPVIASDLEGLAEEIETSVRAEHEAKQKADELERLNAEREEQIAELSSRIQAARARQAELAGTMTDLKVARAAMEEKKLSLREAAASLTRQGEQMNRDVVAGRAEIDADRQRRTEAEQQIASAREEVDRLYAQQTELNREASDVSESREGLQQRLDEVRTQLAEGRKGHEQATEKANACRVELSEADVRIETLITRAAEEMSMDLLDLHEGYEHDEQRDWDAVETEIKRLRDKVERLGNVNLDAIAEQEELDKRREFLDGQLQDVNSSRNQLNDLIRRINRESRDLFLKTFEAVRANFQVLFRKLFGGGKADILLTDPEDVLESGIEVYARPPGKELRTLSLLSGGEKTMTALALMFSIFRSRPSPFCLLDEVDAALDEANTQRFCRLVEEFTEDSQFLIISHAKRTMSMANVLYGVTMQEPGVSRRISVRFEDAANTLDEQLEPVTA